jgi:peptide deformylase
MIINMSTLVKEDNPILRQTAQKVELPLSEEDLNTLRSMAAFVIESQTKKTDSEGNKYVQAVGLAAPQIGISKKMFVLALPDATGKLFIMAFVNPEITSVSRDQFIKLPARESCLSVQSVSDADVSRYKWIRYTGLLVDLQTGETTNKVMSKMQDYLGILFQHEYDHLLGILITDRDETPKEKTKE